MTFAKPFCLFLGFKLAKLAVDQTCFTILVIVGAGAGAGSEDLPDPLHLFNNRFVCPGHLHPRGSWSFGVGVVRGLDLLHSLRDIPGAFGSFGTLGGWWDWALDG